MIIKIVVIDSSIKMIVVKILMAFSIKIIMVRIATITAITSDKTMVNTIGTKITTFIIKKSVESITTTMMLTPTKTIITLITLIKMKRIKIFKSRMIISIMKRMDRISTRMPMTTGENHNCQKQKVEGNKEREFDGVVLENLVVGIKEKMSSVSSKLGEHSITNQNKHLKMHMSVKSPSQKNSTQKSFTDLLPGIMNKWFGNGKQSPERKLIIKNTKSLTKNAKLVKQDQVLGKTEVPPASPTGTAVTRSSCKSEKSVSSRESKKTTVLRLTMKSKKEKDQPSLVQKKKNES